MDYSFSDPDIKSGTYQYRLKLISNQKISYSSIQQVTVRGRQQTINYNRLTQQIFIHGFIDKEDVLQIFDSSGKCIYQKKFRETIEGWQLTTSFLRSGMYIVKTTKAVTKFIITGQ
jgi:hypothetical protein